MGEGSQLHAPVVLLSVHFCILKIVIDIKYFFIQSIIFTFSCPKGTAEFSQMLSEICERPHIKLCSFRNTLTETGFGRHS